MLTPTRTTITVDETGKPVGEGDAGAQETAQEDTAQETSQDTAQSTAQDSAQERAQETAQDTVENTAASAPPPGTKPGGGDGGNKDGGGDKQAPKILPENNPGSSTHWFWKYVMGSRKIYYQVIIASVMINMFALVSSLYIMVVYDQVIPNNAFVSLWAFTAIVIVVMGFDFTMKTIRGMFVDSAGYEIDKRVSADLFDKISSHNVSMNKQATGALANTVRDFETLKDVIGSASFAVFADLPFVILFLFVLYFIGGPVAAVPALIVPIVIIFGLLLQPIMRKISDISSRQGQSKQAVMVEMLSSLHTVKTVRGISILRNRWFQGVINQSIAQRRSRFTSQLATHFTQLGQQASQVGIIVYGVFLIAGANLTMGQLIACVILSGRTLAPLGQITNLLGRLNQAITAYHNLSAVMSKVTDEEKRVDLVSRERLEGAIALKNVTITYEGQKEPSLRDCNLDIRPGERIAVLGRIGSGKTTLLNLVAGVQKADLGAVMLDGVDLQNLRPQDVRNNIGVVLQNPTLFSGTVRENLLIGNPDASDEDLVKAVGLTGASNFIGMLPNGFDFILSERGRELSAGMRQSLAISRALIGDPPILLMDEPTASMDANTEAQIVASLDECTKGKTVIFVTHRGPLVNLADRIVIIDSGRVVLEGPRDEVMEKLQKGN